MHDNGPKHYYIVEENGCNLKLVKNHRSNSNDIEKYQQRKPYIQCLQQINKTFRIKTELLNLKWINDDQGERLLVVFQLAMQVQLQLMLSMV